MQWSRSIGDPWNSYGLVKGGTPGGLTSSRFATSVLRFVVM